jgi:hypothetical protein
MSQDLARLMDALVAVMKRIPFTGAALSHNLMNSHNVAWIGTDRRENRTTKEFSNVQLPSNTRTAGRHIVFFCLTARHPDANSHNQRSSARTKNVEKELNITWTDYRWQHEHQTLMILAVVQYGKGAFF